MEDQLEQILCVRRLLASDLADSEMSLDHLQLNNCADHETRPIRGVNDGENITGSGTVVGCTDVDDDVLRLP